MLTVASITLDCRHSGTQRLLIDRCPAGRNDQPRRGRPSTEPCAFHRLLKTKGWILVGGPGTYRLVPQGAKMDETNSGGDANDDDNETNTSATDGESERARL